MPHQQHQSCIDACNACALACDHCAMSCFHEQNVGAIARCIQLDIDCAAICRLAVSYMGRGSELAGLVCNTCAEVCEACAEECDKHPMEHCKACAQACRRCAQECRAMASASTRRRPAAGARPSAH